MNYKKENIQKQFLLAKHDIDRASLLLDVDLAVIPDANVFICCIQKAIKQLENIQYEVTRGCCSTIMKEIDNCDCGSDHK